MEIGFSQFQIQTPRRSQRQYVSFQYLIRFQLNSRDSRLDLMAQCDSFSSNAHSYETRHVSRWQLFIKHETRMQHT